jgi:hypothetical protein
MPVAGRRAAESPWLRPAAHGFLQDGFCNGFPQRDCAVMALAIRHQRNLNIARRILLALLSHIPYLYA